MKKNNINFFSFLLVFFFIYEIVAIKLNFFSFSFFLFSILFISDNNYYQNNLNVISLKYNKMLENLIYNNDFLKLINIFKIENNYNYINNVKIIGLADIISKEKDYFYINKGYNDGIKIKDIVVNEENLLGIVTNVYPKISKVKYILSPDFQILSTIKDTNSLGLIKYINNNLVFIDIYDSKEIKTNSLVLTYGYHSIPTGIPIGYIYDTNSLKITIKKDLKNSIHTLILRRI
ncbi:MAG: rod shape-determining protein MreC [bacterium]